MSSSQQHQTFSSAQTDQQTAPPSQTSPAVLSRTHAQQHNTWNQEQEQHHHKPSHVHQPSHHPHTHHQTFGASRDPLSKELDLDLVTSDGSSSTCPVSTPDSGDRSSRMDPGLVAVRSSEDTSVSSNEVKMASLYRSTELDVSLEHELRGRSKTRHGQTENLSPRSDNLQEEKSVHRLGPEELTHSALNLQCPRDDGHDSHLSRVTRHRSGSRSRGASSSSNNNATEKSLCRESEMTLGLPLNTTRLKPMWQDVGQVVVIILSLFFFF